MDLKLGMSLLWSLLKGDRITEIIDFEKRDKNIMIYSGVIGGCIGGMIAILKFYIELGW